MPREHEHLAMARRHLFEAEARIANQRRLIARLRERGHPTGLAEDLLKLLLDTEVQMRRHRDELVDRGGGSAAGD